MLLCKKEKKISEPEWQGVCCEIVSHTNVREDTPIKISPTWLRKWELKKRTPIDMLIWKGESS